MTSNVVTNYSKKGHIRLDILVHIPYEESFPRAKQIIEDILVNMPNILKQPEPQIGIESFDSFSVQISIKPYVQPDLYWDATYYGRAKVKAAFSQNNIQVMYPDSVKLGKIGD